VSLSSNVSFRSAQSQILMRSATLSSLKASRRLSTDFRQTLLTTQPLMENLTTWYRSIPNTPHVRDSTIINAASFLHLGYHATRTILFRAIMRPFHNQDHLNGTSTDLEEFEVARNQVRVGVKACATAFTAYVREINAGEFQAFWPFCMYLLCLLQICPKWCTRLMKSNPRVRLRFCTAPDALANYVPKLRHC
jgi:hypothetical protein